MVVVDRFLKYASFMPATAGCTAKEATRFTTRNKLLSDYKCAIVWAQQRLPASSLKEDTGVASLSATGFQFGLAFESVNECSGYCYKATESLELPAGEIVPLLCDEESLMSLCLMFVI
ncbi:hypothetical protein KY290_013548 [Solanum tuberosum]|uniref:Uncharacterized protein n=1 Tax=Solanum tuberosum TaxID=4113 RepID=A0ABQ7VLZ8_SOLTU|nr:hypothetical protein KY289_013656 [Solanum tuberosum]KAH0716983.1 hypothetical protein KY285_013014 [Solanum tuberosum]KAH0769567.1 hypothetical protein KY290_013548 [Solanum tuberosum]